MVMGNSAHKKIKRPLCACGCGQEVKKCRSKFIQGHASRLRTGNKNSFYGKTHTNFVKQYIIAGLMKRNHAANVDHVKLDKNEIKIA